MITPNLTPDATRAVILHVLLDASKKCKPAAFRSFLISAISNVTANISDDYWREFMKVELCSEPGCDCYKFQEKIAQALDEMRDFHRKEMELQQKEGGGV